MGLALDFGLGESGLAQAGVGLGGLGLEAGAVAAPVIPPDPAGALDYFESDVQDNAETISGGIRHDQYWKSDGSRVWTVRDSSDRCDQHDVSPAWSIDPGDWTNLVSITSSFVDPRSIVLTPDGTKLLWNTGAGTVNSIVLPTPFDITSLGATATKFVITSTTTMRWSSDGFSVWIHRLGVIREWAVGTAFDVSTIGAIVKTFDTVPDVGAAGLRTWNFSTDGTKLYGVANTIGDLLVSWDLSTPFDIETESNFETGLDVNVGITLDPSPAGLFFRSDNNDIHIFQNQTNQRMKVFSQLLSPRSPEALDYFIAEISAGTNPGTSGGAARLDVFWKPDGTQVWTGRQGDVIRQYDVSPAWGIDSGDWTQTHVTVAFGDLRSIWWKPDGTLFTFARRLGLLTRLGSFDQSATPWDLTVLGAGAVSGTPADLPADHIWSEDGTRVWIKMAIGITSTVREFSVAVAWDVTTLNTTPVAELDVIPDVGTNFNTMAFSDDGLNLYVMDGQVLSSWPLNTPFDITTTGAYAAGPLISSFRTNIPRGLTFRADNGHIFTGGDQGGGMRFNRLVPSPAPDVDAFSFNAEVNNGAGNVTLQENIWVGPGGENLYTCKSSIATNDVFWFEMSPGHDLSSFAFTNEDNADGQNPRAVALSEDGTVLFVYYRNAVNPDAVFRWPLSTAWDVTTKGARTSLAADFSNDPRGLWFKPDGTQLFLMDGIDATVYQYNLPTPWSFVGATQTDSFALTTSGTDLAFSDDGTKMYVANTVNERIDQYNLALPWEIASGINGGGAFDSGKSLSLPGGTGSDVRGVAVRGNTLYVSYFGNTIVEQFTI